MFYTYKCAEMPREKCANCPHWYSYGNEKIRCHYGDFNPMDWMPCNNCDDEE